LRRAGPRCVRARQEKVRWLASVLPALSSLPVWGRCEWKGSKVCSVWRKQHEWW
jgi:hypothetical protein